MPRGKKTVEAEVRSIFQNLLQAGVNLEKTNARLEALPKEEMLTQSAGERVEALLDRLGGEVEKVRRAMQARVTRKPWGS